MRIDITQIKSKILPTLKQAGVKKSAIFGSYAHGENREDSDIDILIDLPRGKSLFDLVDLQNKLEEILGKKVDLVTYNSLHRLLKNRILGEQIQIL